MNTMPISHEESNYSARWRSPSWRRDEPFVEEAD